MGEELILHAISVKGLLPANALTEVVGADPDEAESLVRAGQVERHETGGTVFLSLSDAGRARLGEWRASLPGPAVENLQSSYDDRFLPVNLRFKRLCSQWQETDEPWDLLDDAEEILEEVDDFLSDAEAASGHYGRYRTRFTTAFRRAEEGDVEAVAGTGGGSWHDAWFELHEDLIQLLGRDRAAEGSA